MKKFLLCAMVLLASALGIAQQPPSTISWVGGRFEAWSYGQWSIPIVTGNSATGISTIQVQTSTVTMTDFRQFEPFAVGTPLRVGLETVTPTAVSNCVLNGIYTNPPTSSCTITANFTLIHKTTDLTSSGTFGLQEALNDASPIGGTIVVDAAWSRLGGTTAMLNAANPLPNVYIEDARGSNPQYYSVQPNTLTALAKPTTLTSGTVYSDSTVTGTWTAITNYFCIAYVDVLGGIGPCSTGYSFSTSASKAVDFTAPGASTGASGWLAFGGPTAATMYQLPITLSTCNLSTSTPITSCAMGSAGQFAAINTTTTQLSPQGTGSYPIWSLSHQTFAYQPAHQLPATTTQADYGPFPQVASAATTVPTVVGTVNLPAGFLNFIHEGVDVWGQITLTGAATTSNAVQIGVGPPYTAGAPVPVCNINTTSAQTAAVYNLNFHCTLTTTATGSSGALLGDGSFIEQLAGGTTAGFLATNQLVSAQTVNVASQDTIYVVFTPTGGTDTSITLTDFHIRPF